MSKIEIGVKAPDFTLTDTQDRPVTLSHFRRQTHVVLVFSRGFF